MTTTDPTTWDAAPVDPALWRAMDEIETCLAADNHGGALSRLHSHAPALIAAVRRLAGRNLDLEATVAQQGAALEATESARRALQQALGDLLRSCEHVAQVTDDPVYDAAQDIWSASLTTEDERRMRRAALAEGSE